jgi:valyl-tRNA synthetase
VPKKIRYYFLALLLLVLSGCASLSEEECLTGDWEGIGYRDGLQGELQSVLSKHQKACSEYQISLNLDDYLQGRKQGLKAYCLPNNGFSVGLRGVEYSYVCPKALEKSFLIEYQRGRTVYLQEQRVDQLETEIASVKKQLKKLTKKIKTTERNLLKEGVSRQERKAILESLREQEREVPLLSSELDLLEAGLIYEEFILRQLR